MYTYSAGSPGTFGTVVHGGGTPEMTDEQLIELYVSYFKMTPEQARAKVEAVRLAEEQRKAAAREDRLRVRASVATPIQARVPGTSLVAERATVSPALNRRTGLVIGAAIVVGAILLSRGKRRAA